jgi:nucleoside-diphosphate-sugar epimerase
MTRVLVTGAGGLVGGALVSRLLEDGVRVVATDLRTPPNLERARAWEAAQPGPEVVWCDLTDSAEVARLLEAVHVDAVVHLAAVIPPLCYADPDLAERVNVGATANLVDAASALADPPRFVQASSIAVYGGRNPHRVTDLLTADTPLAPDDIYGAHKAAAEERVRASDLDWVVLRLGGVLSTDLARPSPDMIHFESVLPTDGRIQTVDVRDVARAFAAAATADVVGQVLLIGGDATHRLTQGEIGPAMAAATGLRNGLPLGRPGDPSDDAGWFATDWMDTGPAEASLDFQRHPWPAMLEEVRTRSGWRRPVARALAPVVRRVLLHRSAYYRAPGVYAAPARAVEAKWGAFRPR